MLEPGIANVTVILTDANGVEVAAYRTDTNGNYPLHRAVPGAYTVSIEVGRLHRCHHLDERERPGKVKGA